MGILSPTYEPPSCPHGYHDCNTCKRVVERVRAAFPFSFQHFRIKVAIISKRRLSMQVEESSLLTTSVGVYEYPWILEQNFAAEVWLGLVHNVAYRLNVAKTYIDREVHERERNMQMRVSKPSPKPVQEAEDIEF